jgi:hypothetical protein
MRFEDLHFDPHFVLPASGHVGYQAIVRFPNGWALSILRGMAPVNLYGFDYEIVQFHHGELQERTVEKLETPAQVERLMAEVEARP